MVLSAAIEVYFPGHWADSPIRRLEISYTNYSRLLWIPSAHLLIGLTGFYGHQKSSIGRLGKVGFLLAAIGFRLDIRGNIIEFTSFLL